MQLNKLSAVTGLLLTAMLSACGGGGDEAPPPAAPAPPAAITVSAVSLSSAKAIAESPLQFDGGVCSGGTGTLTATWDFDDGAGSTPRNHTYLESAAGTRTVKVTCTDTAGTTPRFATLQLNVLSAAMNGFLGKTWTTYAALETNVSPYPVAGLASSGDVYGVWIRRNAGGTNEVAAGQTAVSQTNWTLASDILDTGSDKSPYIDSDLNFGETAPIDMAVSSNGHALAAWIVKSPTAVFSIYYATKSSSSSNWISPSVAISGSVINASIKAVVNDAGDGAIAYCTSSNSAYVVTYINHTLGTPQLISNQCDVLDSFTSNGTTSAYQRHRAFDIAIDGASKLVAVGIQPGTPDASKFSVATQTYSAAGSWTSITRISGAEEIATAPGSLSLSMSPNGSHAAIAWSRIDTSITPYANVYVSMLNGTSWSTAAAYTHDITASTTYDRPMIAVNDSGDAFMTMRLTNSTGKAIAAANYNALATPPQWSTETTIYASANADYRAMDIAIDNWGTGLVTNVEPNSRFSQAGTFAKQAQGSSQSHWSGFKSISATTIWPYYSYGGVHYQTMRALPNGQAILVTSVYDQNPTSSARIPSGYMMLK